LDRFALCSLSAFGGGYHSDFERLKTCCRNTRTSRRVKLRADCVRNVTKQQDFPITKAINELCSLLCDGRFFASTLGVWAMVFLGICILGASLILGKKLGAIFRV